jgi:hypothetical protein
VNAAIRQSKADEWSVLRSNVPLFLVSGRTVKRITMSWVPGRFYGQLFTTWKLTDVSGVQFYNRIKKVRSLVYEPDDRATDIEISRGLVTWEATAVTDNLWLIQKLHKYIPRPPFKLRSVVNTHRSDSFLYTSAIYDLWLKEISHGNNLCWPH